MKLPQFLGKYMNVWKEKGKQRPLTAKEKWMLFLLSGVLLAVIVFPTGNSSEKSVEENELWGADISKASGGYNDRPAVSTENFSDEMLTLKQYEAYLSAELEAIISQIDGAGNVEAWVTLSGSSEKILYQEKDSDTTDLQESDSVGGSRSEKTENLQQTVLLDSSGNPYIVKTMQPEVEGVLVVAEGAGDSVVKKNITEAVEVLFGIDVHRIKVAKKKLEE